MVAVESTPVPTVNVDLKVQVEKTEKKQSNKDLQKTRLCVYNLEGKCGYGSNCTFAHSPAEIKNVPDLKKTQLCAKFAEGKCNNKNCSYAHGEAELRDPPNLKKKMCKWHVQGVCRNGAQCGFAHDIVELRSEGPPGLLPPGPPGLVHPGSLNMTSLAHLPPPPGLTKMEDENDDASTEVPASQAGTDLSSVSKATIPEENLFRFMAGRGSAPLQNQVAMMSSAIVSLQAKLSQLEDKMLQNQVVQMQQQIAMLTEQCSALESGLGASQRPAGQTSLRSRLSSRATPFKPNDGKSGEGTTVESN